ncbi:DUF3352 domain-containing protein [Pleurocapsa sp. PCC 7319]|uniref:DUF3352 domain-containing protein n=1 Tax=Pleurocapsa sp. PCC 7319 TaxID=118161 RepID=UPI000371DD36|nr:DUF3352 domain-containing protein [Pleurocapsa sp. PCC 7319]
MKFRSFFWTIAIGAVVIFLVAVTSLGWIATQSSINLFRGGVNGFPQGAAFIPKQAPAMISLLTNPEKLYALRQVSLPLKRRQSDRQEWQQWETNLLSKIGLDYRHDLKPWLGDEITFAITSLDYDRNPQNGAQPGYLLATETKNQRLAHKSLENSFAEQDNTITEQYRGAKIISLASENTDANPPLWASAVVGNFVLFANQSSIIKEAINQAQAVNLNLEHSDDFQTALNNLKPPHVGIAYLNILRTSAWLDKSPVLPKLKTEQILSASLSIYRSGLAAETALIGIDEPKTNSQTYQSFLNKPELQQIFNSLPFDRHNSAYIDIKDGVSLLAEQIPLYKVLKLAIQSLFPHLKAIAIKNSSKEDGINRANILFKLD